MQVFSIRPVRDSNREQIIRIFNHYVTTGFAAYPDTPVPAGFFDLFGEGAFAFSVAENNGQVVGFSVLKLFPVFQILPHCDGLNLHRPCQPALRLWNKAAGSNNGQSTEEGHHGAACQHLVTKP
jgi:hypothetical protein